MGKHSGLGLLDAGHNNPHPLLKGMQRQAHNPIAVQQPDELFIDNTQPRRIEGIDDAPF